MPITTTIRATGNSAGVVIPKTLLDLLDWKVGTTVKIVPSGDKLTISRVTSKVRE